MASVPSSTWLMLEQRMSFEPLPKGLDAVWDIGVGFAGRVIPRRKRFLRQAQRISALDKQFSELKDSKLHQVAEELREIFHCNRDTSSDLERAFALVREVAFRQIGEKPFPVQIAGALALNAGCVTEMATGEGKTLTATMPVTVAGWRGHGCHIITVNDYLASRDAEWMGRIYRFCGLTVSFIEHQMTSEERKRAYMADITYCTNKEVTADFLRDRLVLGNTKGLCSSILDKIITGGRVSDRLVQRGLNYAIVDEADSILVDEAVTPLIISGDAPNPEQIESFRQAAYARISFQRFFRMYRKLSGMTGTASEASSEFWQIYHLPVVSVPTNRPCIRKNLPNIVLPTESAKWARIVEEIHRIYNSGRPILVGTRSVRASEQLSELLKAKRLDHQVLNAVYHKQEAQIVAEAGQRGKITVATNMAGRGTDIKLGRGVAQMGGLHVIAAEPNESARIDRQLYGRCARQGDPGSAQGIFSLEDEIVTRYTKNSAAYFRKKHANKEGDISSPVVRGVFRLAQIKAERLALRRRKSVLRADHWLDEQLGFTGSE